MKLLLRRTRVHPEGSAENLVISVCYIAVNSFRNFRKFKIVTLAQR
jgi:hypothetical protein